MILEQRSSSVSKSGKFLLAYCCQTNSISHHPPVTAYCVSNEKHGVMLQGYNGQKASFSRRIDIKQVGHALLHLKEHNEYYLITLPSLHIEGLITGSPFVELDKSTFIQSSTGYTSKIDYSGRGWMSGKKNSVIAHMYLEGKPSEALYTVDGTMDQLLYNQR